MPSSIFHLLAKAEVNSACCRPCGSKLSLCLGAYLHQPLRASKVCEGPWLQPQVGCRSVTGPHSQHFAQFQKRHCKCKQRPSAFKLLIAGEHQWFCKMLWSRRVREGVFQRQFVCQHSALGLAASTEASLQHSKHHPPIILVIHDPNHQSCWVAQKHPGASMHKPNTTCILQFAYSTRSVRQRCCTVMQIASKALSWSGQQSTFFADQARYYAGALRTIRPPYRAHGALSFT